MADTTDVKPNGNGPWWVQVLYRFGIPAGIALFLIYFLTQTVTRDLSNVSGAATAAAAAAATAAATAEATMAAAAVMRAEHQELRYYLRAICLNTSSTAGQRAACLTLERP